MSRTGARHSLRRARRAALGGLVATLFRGHRGEAPSGRPTAAAAARHHRPGRGTWRAPDLVHRDFGADELDRRWFANIEIPTADGKLCPSSVLDIGSRRAVGSCSEHPDATCAYQAQAMAVAVRGGDVAGVALPTDGGGETGAGPNPVGLPVDAQVDHDPDPIPRHSARA